MHPRDALLGGINWAFTVQWFLALVALVALGVLFLVLWQIWRETR